MADLTTHKMTTSNTTAPALETTISTDTTTNNELEIDIVDELYPWAMDDSEKRRAFIFQYFNWNPDIHVDAQLQQLARVEKWLSGR